MSVYNPLGVRAENGGYIRANRNGDVITAAPSTLPYPTLVPASASNNVGSMGSPWMNGYFSGQVQAATVSATTVSATTVNATNFVGAVVPAANFLPLTNATFNIGSAISKWKDIYWSGVAYGGGLSLTAQATTYDIVPAAGSTYSVGTNAVRYQDLFLNGTATVATAKAALFAAADGVTVRIGDATTSPNASFAIAIGPNAANAATAAITFPPIAIGQSAMSNSAGGSNNIALGMFAGQYIGGTDNFCAGYNAGKGDIGGASGSYNVCIGRQSNLSHTTGTANISIGSNTNRANTTGIGSVFIGHSAGNGGLGSFPVASCVGIGYQALTSITTGATGLTAIGYNCLTAVTSGTALCAVGYAAGSAAMTSANSTFIGYQAGLNCTGNNNTFLGCNAGSGAVGSADNTMIGYGTTCAATGGSNTIIGSSSLTSAAVDRNCVLGANNSIGHSNCVVLGTTITTAAANRLYLGSAAQALGTATSIGAAGGATALPATPTTYLIAYVNGTQYKIPLYNP